MRHLLLVFALISTSCFAVEKVRSFEQSLNGIQSIMFSVPLKARAQLAEMEAIELKQDQPRPLLVRYFLQRATVDLLLNEPSHAIEIAQKGISIAKLDPLLKSEQFRLQLRLSQALLLQGQNQEVLDQLNTLLEASSTLQDPSVTAEILLVKGQAYRDKSEYDVSLAALMSSLETAKTSGDDVLIERIASNLGGVLIQLNGFDKASMLLDQSYKFFRQRKMSFNQLLVKIDMAELAKKQGDRKKALAEYKQALTIAQVLGDGSHRFRINLQIADLLLEAGETKSMMKYLRSVESLRDRESIRYYVSKYNLLKANQSLINEKYQQAAEFISPLLDEQKGKGGLYRTEIDLYLAASKAYFGLEDYKNAYLTLLDYQNRFGIFTEDQQIGNLERQQMLFNLEKLKAENQQLSWDSVLKTLELENTEQKIEYLNIIVIGASGAALFASLIALWINRRRIRWGKIANTDSLTGLYNRRYLSSQVKILNKKMVTEKTALSCLLLDIDHFKKVNDTYGHPIGDNVLTGVAEMFLNNVRRDDVCARFGGEEFFLLLPNTELEQAKLIAEDLRVRISELKFNNEQGTPFSITASFGVMSVHEQQTLSELSDQVDKLLYLAKQNGRNRVEVDKRKATDTQAEDKQEAHMSDKMHQVQRKLRRLGFRFVQRFSG